MWNDALCVMIVFVLLFLVCIRAERIERISAPSLRDFMDNFAMQSKPVIITNYSSPFVNMTREHILNKCGHSIVEIVRFNKSMETWANLQGVRLEKMRDFIDSSKENSNSEIGIFDFPLPRKCPEMLENYWTVPKYIVQDFFQRVSEKKFFYKSTFPSLFFGLPDSFGGLHRDSGGTAFWQYVIEGKKDWRVLSSMTGEDHLVRDLNFFGDSGIRVWEGVVEPGEFIYIPGNCPHQVKNIGETLAMSGNLISKDSLESMKAEVLWARRQNIFSRYNAQLQDTIMRPGFDTSFSYDAEDLSWHEYKLGVTHNEL